MPTPQLSTNQLVVWVALLLGLLLAIVFGGAIGGSDVRLVAVVLASAFAALLFIKLKTNIWILMPLGWLLTGRLQWLPLPLSVRDMSFLIPIVFYAAFLATRVVSWKRKLRPLDYLIYINLAYLITVYVRHPVGTWAFQSSMVGGRPYFEILLSFFGFMILSRVKLSDFIASILPYFFMLPAIAVGLLDVIATLSPGLGFMINSVYSGVGSSVSGMLDKEAQVGETRFVGLLSAGMNGVLLLCSKYNPISLISPLHPLRVMFLLLSLGAIFLSGFRSALLFAMMAFFVSTYMRRRLFDLWIAAGVVLLSLVVLISLQGSVLQLPKTMQRTLSWLPGDWNEEAVSDAEGSSRWRFEMWGWAWNDERIIRDKVWGQGFGLSLEDMNIIASALMSQQAGAINTAFIGGSDRENFMITGAFHSGPLSAIKFIGVVGLLLYYPMMCYMAVLAWRLCRRAYGTKAFTLALFIGIPMIYEPFNFVIIFGGLDSNYPQILFWAGMLNLVNNYLDGMNAKKVDQPVKDNLPARPALAV